MRSLMILIAACLVSAAPRLAAAQTGSGSAAAGSAAGSAAVGDDPGAAGAPAPLKMPVPPEPSPEELRKTCADAMNKNPGFADDIVKTINEDTARQHEKAAAAIAKNEKHVVLAYAAMWVIAALFLIFLWRRQRGLQTEIANLKRDLEAAAK
jgi:hypothetical protein